MIKNGLIIRLILCSTADNRVIIPFVAYLRDVHIPGFQEILGIIQAFSWLQTRQSWSIIFLWEGGGFGELGQEFRLSEARAKPA
jgi:hypothetical protein